MKVFSDKEFVKYNKEAKEKWGNTESFSQYEEKTEDYSNDKWNILAKETDGIMAEFSACIKSGAAPSSDTAQSLVKKLQKHITERYYNCTDEILLNLGQMYVADERFRSNIDRHFEGTAEFICKAIIICLRGDKDA